MKLHETGKFNRETGGGPRKPRFFPRLFAGVLILVILPACTGDPPKNLGVRNGKLAPCPDSPNCVSSFARDAEHKIEPLMFSPGPEEIFRRLKQVLRGFDRVEIIQEDKTYLRAEFTSLIFRFVDDVEFYLDTRTGTLHFRSASRLGESDLGVNRERIEAIKAKLTAGSRNTA